MSGGNRRQGDKLALEMHGDIKVLLERTRNIDEMNDRISKNEGSILGIKWVGGVISVFFVAITGYLGAKK